MKKLCTYFGDTSRNPKDSLERMIEENADFITWTNSFTNARFLAKKSTVEKMVEKKFSLKTRNEKDILAKEIEAEIIKISNNSMTTDEIRYELDANNIDELELKEGFGIKQKITRESINLIDKVLYDPNFNLNTLFAN